MSDSIKFILNSRTLETQLKPGTTMLDFVRENQHLKGTKIGCREGDCGACTVLVGRLDNHQMHYRSMTSCLMPLGNAHGKHVVTIEGLNLKDLTPVQQSIVDQGASQCGFCTVGFVVSLSGYCLSSHPVSQEQAISAMDGNICRCTGYKSLERAATQLNQKLADKPEANTVNWLIQQQFLPAYFDHVPQRLAELEQPWEPAPNQDRFYDARIAGGTDLLVQNPEGMAKTLPQLIQQDSRLIGIDISDSSCVIGGATPTEDLKQCSALEAKFPGFKSYLSLVSSTPIRNMASVAGNLVNASPIGDLSILFLALDATLTLNHQNQERTLPLKEFFLDYKQLAKTPEEIVTAIRFDLPEDPTYLGFQKVCKRRYLDIASVNTALCLTVKEQTITKACLAAGGVAPIPKFLHKASSFLEGKTLSVELIGQCLDLAQEEIAPISDVRGSERYKRQLMRQQFLASFLEQFPQQFQWAVTP